MEKAQSGKPAQVYESLAEWARDAAQVLTVPMARVLARWRVHPNTLTLLGCLLSIGVGGVIASGRLTLGGWLLTIVAPMDALDGALARLTGRSSRFGAFLDSTLDRVSEAVLLLCLAAHYLWRGATTEVLLAFLTLIGANLVSYTRARAEASGYACKIGFFTRLERMALLAVGLILNVPTIALWVLAVGSNLTALWRILYVYSQARRDSSE
ncbi:MAG: CDP-alcohol phosphatidyltransferase family protein [Anaerolineae bacterium]|nr:CDP-alcohol phosphatidyltransferase family protein [Anaerolineae bacterium]MDW8067927.1 CDP-alcohol phosphatidyltransferase family protein [Anaerolineae bacterium]